MRTEIEKLRQEVDRIDDQIKILFEQRLALALDIGKVKAAKDLPIQDVARENTIISRLTTDQDDEMAEYTKALFITLFEASRFYQRMKLGRQ